MRLRNHFIVNKESGGSVERRDIDGVIMSTLSCLSLVYFLNETRCKRSKAS
jgi:hypothetical protein